jgi:hypothetical protein
LVVAHPTLIEINIFAARRPAIGQNLISIQAKGSLQIVRSRGDIRGAGSLRGLGRRLSQTQASRPARNQKSCQDKEESNCAGALLGALCRHKFTSGVMLKFRSVSETYVRWLSASTQINLARLEQIPSRYRTSISTLRVARFMAGATSAKAAECPA